MPAAQACVVLMRHRATWDSTGHGGTSLCMKSPAVLENRCIMTSTLPGQTKSVRATVARGPAPEPNAAAFNSTWTQRQAAAFLGVSVRYLRSSACPKLLLPGTGMARKPLVRYDAHEVVAWRDAYRSDRRMA
jgi:hypothetical protein